MKDLNCKKDHIKTFENNKSTILRTVANLEEEKVNLECLKISKQKQINKLQYNINRLKHKHKIQNSSIQGFNDSCVDIESKTLDWRNKLNNAEKEHKWLKQQATDKKSKVGQLHRKIENLRSNNESSTYLNDKSDNLDINSIDANKSEAPNKPKFWLDLDKCADTKDTILNTGSSNRIRSRSKNRRCYNTCNLRSSELILSQRKNSLSERLKSNRDSSNKKTRIPDFSAMLNDISSNLSDREINEKVISMDDTLSEVPVKELNVTQNGMNFWDQSLQFDLNELSIGKDCIKNFDVDTPDNQETMNTNGNLLSSSKDINTPSFNHKITRRDSGKNENRLSVGTTLNFDDPLINVEFPGLSNIPEVLDESNMYSDATLDRRKSLNKNSCYNTNDDYVTLSGRKSNLHHFTTNAINNDDLESTRSKLQSDTSNNIFGAFKSFVNHKKNNSMTNENLFSEAERLTFSNRKSDAKCNQKVRNDLEEIPLQNLSLEEDNFKFSKYNGFKNFTTRLNTKTYTKNTIKSNFNADLHKSFERLVEGID